MKRKKIKIRSAKAKGRRLQKWTANMISRITSLPWGPDELIASREGGQSGTDIRLLGVAKKLFPFSVECKNQETWSMPEWIRQAQANELPDTTWLLVAKRNHINPVVVMDAEKFFQLWDKVLRLMEYEYDERI